MDKKNSMLIYEPNEEITTREQAYERATECSYHEGQPSHIGWG